MTNFPPLGGFLLLGFLSRVAPWLRAHEGMGIAILIIGFALSAGLSLLPTYACSILAGWTFGFGVGFAASMISFVLASLVAWWVNSVVAGDRVLAVVKDHPKWEAVRLALLGRGFWPSFGILTLVRVPPTSPFAMMNFIAATTRAPLGAYLLATLIGMSPRTAAVVWAASKLQKLDFNGAKGEVWMTPGRGSRLRRGRGNHWCNRQPRCQAGDYNGYDRTRGIIGREPQIIFGRPKCPVTRLNVHSPVQAA